MQFSELNKKEYLIHISLQKLNREKGEKKDSWGMKDL